MYGEKGVKSGLYDEMSNAFTSVMKLGSGSGFGFDPRDVEMFDEFFSKMRKVRRKRRRWRISCVVVWRSCIKVLKGKCRFLELFLIIPGMAFFDLIFFSYRF
ncbi:hypothetical protein Hanom_Chr16g01521631 [Helianthus anomalus]